MADAVRLARQGWPQGLAGGAENAHNMDAGGVRALATGAGYGRFCG